MEQADQDRLKKGIEALIFISPEGIGKDRLAEVLEVSEEEIVRTAEDLAGAYRDRNSGLAIIQVAGGYQMTTCEEVAPLLDRLLTVTRRRNLSQAAMETLAIIAYRQPVTRPEIEAVRGVDTGRVITGLLEKKLVRISGRKKAPGRPMVYATTRDFLVHFGLESLRDLPVLSELGPAPDQAGDIEVEAETEAEE
jgi:segregation and condensation protein B